MLPVSLRNSSAMAMFSARRRWRTGPRFVYPRLDLRDVDPMDTGWRPDQRSDGGVACPAPEDQRDPVPPHIATRATPELSPMVILSSSRVVGTHRQVA